MDVALDLKLVLEYLAKGRLEDAEAICAAELEENPRNSAALRGLAMVALRRKDHFAAIRWLRRELELQPSAWSFATLSATHTALCQFDEALDCAERAHELEPTNIDVLCRLAAARSDLGQLDDAISCYRTVLELRPGHAVAHNNLGIMLTRKGESLSALACFERAVRLDRTLADGRLNLARALLERDELDRALPHAQEAVRLKGFSATPPDREPALLSLGSLLHAMDRFDDARHCFEEVLAANPISAGAYTGLGGVLQQLGDHSGAIAAYRAALRIDGRQAGALARLAMVLDGELPAADALSIEELLQCDGISAEHRASLEFALAHWHDAAGRFDQAATFARDANAHQATENRARGMGYDPEEHSRFVDGVIGAFSAELFTKVREWGLESQRPIFVVGLPRSGTSLVEQILATHPQVVGAGELRSIAQSLRSLAKATPGQTPAECLGALTQSLVRTIAERYLRQLHAIDAMAGRVVDKMPENALHLGWISVLFPKATLIHCNRDARDVALSCWMTNFARLRWTNDAEHIAARVCDHDRMMGHWRSALLSPIVEVQYEDLVTNFEPEARRLIAACGLEWNAQCLAFHKTQRPVATASYAQVRRPIYQSSVGRWRNYRQTLPELFAGMRTTARGESG
jgi:tetratricopeptide (TPR) repeat protein